MVGVLVLINQHVLEATTVEVHHLGMLIEDADDLTHQIINHSVLSADSSLVNCTPLRVALRSWLLNDSMEFVV